MSNGYHWFIWNEDIEIIFQQGNLNAYKNQAEQQQTTWKKIKIKCFFKLKNKQRTNQQTKSKEAKTNKHTDK